MDNQAPNIGGHLVLAQNTYKVEEGLKWQRTGTVAVKGLWKVRAGLTLRDIQLDLSRMQQSQLFVCGRFTFDVERISIQGVLW